MVVAFVTRHLRSTGTRPSWTESRRFNFAYMMKHSNLIIWTRLLLDLTQAASSKKNEKIMKRRLGLRSGSTLYQPHHLMALLAQIAETSPDTMAHSIMQLSADQGCANSPLSELPWKRFSQSIVLTSELSKLRLQNIHRPPAGRRNGRRIN